MKRMASEALSRTLVTERLNPKKLVGVHYEAHILRIWRMRAMERPGW